jgi:Tat protein secretion system quality control protein TatD with DNase activity
VSDAVRIRLVEIGEAVKALPEELTTTETDIPWRQIARMRDHLAPAGDSRRRDRTARPDRLSPADARSTSFAGSLAVQSRAPKTASILRT